MEFFDSNGEYIGPGRDASPEALRRGSLLISQ